MNLSTSRPVRPMAIAAVAVAALGLGLAGCGSSEPATDTSSSQRLTDAQVTALAPAYRGDVAAAEAVIGPKADTTNLAALAANARAWQKAGAAWVTALDSVADELADGPCHDALRTVAFAQAAEDVIIGNIADAAAAGDASDVTSHLEDYREVRAGEETEALTQGVLDALKACGVPEPEVGP